MSKTTIVKVTLKFALSEPTPPVDIGGYDTWKRYVKKFAQLQLERDEYAIEVDSYPTPQCTECATYLGSENSKRYYDD